MKDATQLAEQFFRHESGRLVASLVRSLGAEHIQLAEDVVQEAIVRALRTWPYYGVPENPAAWITLTAKNLALDSLRHQSVLRRKQAAVFGARHSWTAEVQSVDLDSIGVDIEDAVLRLLFVCCHPGVPRVAQLALALRTLCGLSVGEIASALLSTDQAVARRITRAKDRLKELKVEGELPPETEIRARVDGVLKTLYLMFNEGYKSASGPSLLKPDLCLEAIRLTRMAATLPVATPSVHALLALMCFQAARFPAREDPQGTLLTLAEQDRTMWDRSLIQEGMAHLARSAVGESVDAFHLQAAIAGVHCSAERYSDTDWPTVLRLYDLLVHVEDSRVTRLNRAVAVWKVHGPAAGLAEALPLTWDDYYLWHAVVGEMQREAGHSAAAAHAFHRAMGLASSEPEKRHLLKRFKSVSEL